MALDDENYQSFLQTLAFADQLSVFQNENLTEIQKFLEQSATDLMDHVTNLSKQSESKRDAANDLMEKAHLNPSRATAHSIAANQKAVDQIIEEAQEGASTDDAEAVLAAHKRREGSKFSKNIEAIVILEEKLTKIFHDLAGALSEEDVLHQLLRNIGGNQDYITGIHQDLPQHLKDAQEVRGLSKRLTALVDKLEKQCKSTEELRLFQSVFRNVELGIENLNGFKEAGHLARFLFLRFRYHHFLGKQLESIRQGYARIIDQAMDMIYQINSTQDDSNKHANSMMLKVNESAFANQSMEKFEEQEASFLEGIPHEERPHKEFAVTRELLTQMNADVGDHLMSMMGALSVGDVIAQRINNIIAFNGAISKICHHMSENPEGHLTFACVAETKQACLKFIRKKFVTEEERKLFESLFGHDHQAA